MKTPSAPKARARSRLGMKPLDWHDAPSPDDFWPDKINVDVRGRVSWPDGVSFFDYLKSIGQHRALKTNPSVGRKYRARINFGTIVGQITIQMMAGSERADSKIGGQATVLFSLFLNPTRTRALAARRSTNALEGLTLSRFFSPIALVGEVFPEDDRGDHDRATLDGNDNVLGDAKEAGGTTPDERAATRDAFMVLYEQRVKELLCDILTPRPAPPFDGPDPLDDARGAISVVIDWEDLTLCHAEVYVERSTKDAVKVVMNLYDRGRTLARVVRGARYSEQTAKFSGEIDGDFPHLLVPLTGTQNIELSLYAKTERRVRFEVRYRAQFSRVIGSERTRDRPLASAICALIEDAAKRMPWKALRATVEMPPPIGVSDLLDFLGKLTDAVQPYPELRGRVLRSLIYMGSLKDDESPAMAKVIKRLVKSGVVQRVAMQQRESLEGRRFGLTERYFHTRSRAISGFLPTYDELLEAAAVARGKD